MRVKNKTIINRFFEVYRQFEFFVQFVNDNKSFRGNKNTKLKLWVIHINFRANLLILRDEIQNKINTTECSKLRKASYDSRMCVVNKVVEHNKFLNLVKIP